MSLLEHFHVFETLLYGLALAHILVGIARSIRNRVKFYWLHLIAVAAATLTILHRYFYLIVDYHFENLTRGYQFLFFDFAPLACLFLITYLLFPDSHEKIDFKSFFWDQAFNITLLLALFAGLVAIRNYFSHIVSGNVGVFSADFLTNIALTGVFCLLGLYGYFARSAGVVKIVVVLAAVFNMILIATATLQV